MENEYEAKIYGVKSHEYQVKTSDSNKQESFDQIKKWKIPS